MVFNTPKKVGRELSYASAMPDCIHGVAYKHLEPCQRLPVQRIISMVHVWLLDGLGH